MPGTAGTRRFGLATVAGERPDVAAAPATGLVVGPTTVTATATNAATARALISGPGQGTCGAFAELMIASRWAGRLVLLGDGSPVRLRQVS
jgi:hypothetical protein